MDTSKNRSVASILKMIQRSSGKQQIALLRELTNSIHSLQTSDLKTILNFFISINDNNLEVKLISFLAACVAANDTHYDIIIFFNPIYEKIASMLSAGLTTKTSVVFNFITALVFNDADNTQANRNQSEVHAKTMIRVSGCLRMLCTFFLNTMMFLDTWKSLCQCVAEACRNCQLNKDQCSHLIPVCLQKCQQGYNDVLGVLESLLSNHTKNIQKFIRCNGLYIFTSDNLQYTVCLQLLSSLVQNSQKAVQYVTDNGIHKCLSEILQWSGPYSQKGQWCTIILYYINNVDSEQTTGKSQRDILLDDEDKEKELQCDNFLSNDVTVEAVEQIASKENHQNSNMNETNKLLQNIVKEIFYWQAKENKPQPGKLPVRKNYVDVESTGLPQDTPRTEMYSSRILNNIRKYNGLQKHRDYRQETPLASELSFSFLKEDVDSERDHCVTAAGQEYGKSFNKVLGNSEKYHNKALNKAYKGSEKSCQTHSTAIQTSHENIEKSFIDSKLFNPAVVSTPKVNRNTNKPAIPREKTKTPSLRKYQDKISGHKTLQSKTISKLYEARLNNIQKKKMRQQKRSSPVKLANRSMSAKIIDAVNETCTTFVKSVKDIFMPWKQASKSSNIDVKNKDTIKHALSFTDYMKKRDAILGDCEEIKEGANFSWEGDAENACKTCNDTVILKQKLLSDKHLKSTLKKLKLGINLYGCDFKKISKNMWSQETYMTPTVLYNLYRKLILK